MTSKDPITELIILSETHDIDNCQLKSCWICKQYTETIERIKSEITKLSVDAGDMWDKAVKDAEEILRKRNIPQ